jgi:hypothetical protein
MSSKGKDKKRVRTPAEDDKPVGLFEAEDDAPPEPVQEETPEQRAKKAFLGLMEQPIPEVKHSSGGGGSATVEGVVLRATNIMVEGRTGKVPKRQLTIAVTNVMASNAKDIISPGVDGMHFVLPTTKLEPSPEDVARDKYSKPTYPLDVHHANTKLSYLGTISASFYIENEKDKDNSKVDVASICPGMHVVVSGIGASFGKNGPDGLLFTNAKKVSPSTGVIAPGDAAQALIDVACSAKVMAASTFLWSSVMGGFHGLTYSEPVHQLQVDILSGKWAQLVQGSASKCEALAMSLGTDPSVASTVAALQGQAARIKEIKHEDAAMGAPVFMIDLPKDCMTPYQAPLVQLGLSPSNSEMLKFTSMLFDSDQRAKLPNSFTEAKVVNVAFQGNLVTLDFRIFYVSDRAAAGAAVADGINPLLYTHKPAASVKISKKTLGGEMLGTVVDKKIEFATREVIKYCDMAVWAPIFPRGPDDSSLNGHFGNTNGIDIKTGILRAGIAVSSEWLDKNMLNGRGVMVYTALDGVTTVESNGNPPVISKNYIQALSETSWDISKLRKQCPANKRLEFRVLYDGCSGDVAKSDKIAESVEAGEAHLADVVPMAREDGDVEAFLLEDSLVYAIAVDA